MPVFLSETSTPFEILLHYYALYTEMDHSDIHSNDLAVASPESSGSFFGERLFKPMNYDDLEDPELYRVDGYHPVHLHDYLGDNNRYKVVHKLGSGRLSIVWLCRDLEKSASVALKVLIAGASEDDYCVELLSLIHI